MRIQKRQALAGAALIGAGIIEALSMGVPCPVCVASIGTGAFALKKSVIP